MRKKDPDHATRDLFEHIAAGNEATWSMYVQVMPEAEASTYKWNVFDVTKVWPHGDYPLVPVGRLVLNRNPINYFAEVEQAAFSPGHLVPGIEISQDRMLQARVFSYPDTHVRTSECLLRLRLRLSSMCSDTALAPTICSCQSTVPTSAVFPTINEVA